MHNEETNASVRCTRVCALLALLLVAALPTALHGQTSCADIERNLSQAKRFDVVVLLADPSQECLGGKRDEADVTKAVHALVSKDPKDLEKRREAAAGALDAVITHVKGLNAGTSDSPLPLVILRLEEARSLLDSAQPVTFPGNWRLDANQPILNRATAFPLADYLGRHCSGAPETPPCPEAYADAKSAVRATVLAERALTLWRNDQVMSARKRLTLLANQWDAYFNDARSQYPWELWINGEIVEKKFPLEQLPNGYTGGYRKVPNWQLIVAHPGLVLEHVDEAEDGSRQKAAAVLEVLGINRWSYKGDGSMGRALGASLIYTASDRAGVPEEGWGLLLHINNRYSIGATRHGGDTGYVLSTDLAKLWTKVSEKAKKMQSDKDEP